MKTSPNHYDILHITRDASSSEIKSAYRNLAKTHHPDVGGKKEDFQLIAEAYEILSDPAKRSEYDITLDWQQSSNTSHHPYQKDNPSNTNNNSQRYYRFDHPLDPYSSQVVDIINRLNAYHQVADAIQEILPLMSIISTQAVNKERFINFSSTIAIMLMNIITNDANNMVQNYHSHFEIDKRGIKLAYRNFTQIGQLKMDRETRETFTTNRKEMGKTVHSLSDQPINYTAQVAAILIYLCFVFIYSRTERVNIYSAVTVILLSYYLYKVIRFTIYVILKTIDSILWNIRILFY